MRPLYIIWGRPARPFSLIFIPIIWPGFIVDQVKTSGKDATIKVTQILFERLEQVLILLFLFLIDKEYDHHWLGRIAAAIKRLCAKRFCSRNLLGEPSERLFPKFLHQPLLPLLKLLRLRQLDL